MATRDGRSPKRRRLSEDPESPLLDFIGPSRSGANVLTSPAFLRPRQSDGLAAVERLRARRRLMDNALSSFPYCQKLRGHHSCINALAFSRGDGRYLASAGDDRNVLIWDMHSDDEVKRPSARFRGPRSNVFTVAFNATNTHLYSGGNDAIVLRYDLSRLPTAPAAETSSTQPPNDVFLDHSVPRKSPRAFVDTYGFAKASVHSVAPHPHNEHTFLSASEDGEIRFEDCRSHPTRQGVIVNNASFTDVKWHPLDGNLFISSDQKGRVTLHDARMSFKSGPTKRSDVVVTNYLTTLSMSLGGNMEALLRPESSSISFTSSGTMFAVEFLLFGPVLYSLADPIPVLTLTGDNLPDGQPVPSNQRSYTNRCTTKHGSFGGEEQGDLYYATGSDDFRGYCWKVPPLHTLLDRREEVSVGDWRSRETIEMAFSQLKSSPKHVPVRLRTPTYRLEGHRSIVNTVLFHPEMPLLVTSGIEKVVRLFSHFPQQPSHRPVDASETRELPDGRNARILISALTGDLSTEDDVNEYSRPGLRNEEEDEEAIALFDELLHEEQTELSVEETFERLRGRVVEDSDSEREDSSMSDDDEG